MASKTLFQTHRRRLQAGPNAIDGAGGRARARRAGHKLAPHAATGCLERLCAESTSGSEDVSHVGGFSDRVVGVIRDDPSAGAGADRWVAEIEGIETRITMRYSSSA